MVNTLAASISMTNLSYIIAGIVIAFFAAAFIGIAVLYFNSKKRNIDNHLEDVEIEEEAKQDYKSFAKRKKTTESIVDYYEKKKRFTKRISDINTVIAVNIYLIVLTCVGFAFLVSSQNQLFWFLNETSLIVETNSMATAYSGNTYLLDENGNLNEDDRIKQYTLITISKDQNYVNNIKPFDVVAFKMKSTNDNYLTVIHRLINVDYDEHNEPLYTFRGDANPSSMAGEIKVKKNMIVGVFQTNGYQGKKNVPLGYIVGYLRSSIGMIVVITAFFLLIIYTALFDRILEVYNARYNLVLIYRCVAYDIEHAEDSSYVNIDSTYDFSYINVLNQKNLKLE